MNKFFKCNECKKVFLDLSRNENPTGLVELKAKPTSNNLVYSQHAEISVRAAIKSVQRDLKTYRHDLVHIALKKLYLLRKYKLNNKFANKKEAKTIKA